jgi:hypothetical protein
MSLTASRLALGAAFFLLLHAWLTLWTWRCEAKGSSETLVKFYWTTWCYMPGIALFPYVFSLHIHKMCVFACNSRMAKLVYSKVMKNFNGEFISIKSIKKTTYVYIQHFFMYHEYMTSLKKSVMHCNAPCTNFRIYIYTKVLNLLQYWWLMCTVLHHFLWHLLLLTHNYWT